MLIQPGDQMNFVFEHPIEVRWYDMDAFGHVNTCIYFTYFEQTRIAWFIKIAPTYFAKQNEGPVVVQANCTYIKPIVHPETIIVKLFVGNPRRSSFETQYEVRSQKNSDLLYAEGYVKIVWVSRETGRSIPLADELRKLLPQE